MVVLLIPVGILSVAVLVNSNFCSQLDLGPWSCGDWREILCQLAVVVGLLTIYHKLIVLVSQILNYRNPDAPEDEPFY